ncbi:hypothetical protein LMJ53_14240 [Rheinheimera sp. UJ51]|uniref:hypothetical protein n=1 Tax=Rheinheimera sp. UJ51 TaxID=2892446 RepID=UPI001E5142B9|nr:hypothetical protein [Rheinheimera sp. UJ51]MCC5452883.1 hypothetical protein [Rheinheimera sp. UJ51]
MESQVIKASLGDQNPLFTLVDEQLLSPYLHERHSEHGAFFPLPFQTGIGKTYTALKLIIWDMVWQAKENAKPRLIVFITDSIDNVKNAFTEINRLIDDESTLTTEEKNMLKDRIVYLPSQKNQLLDTSPSDVEKILQLFDLQNSELYHDWKEISALRELAGYHPDEALNRSVDKYAAQFYSKLVRYMQTVQQSDKPIRLNNVQQSLLEKLLPGERIATGKAHVMLMTTKKYLKGIDTVTGKYRPLRELNRQWLIIDEVDKQSAEILSELLNNKADDLLQVIRTLLANFKLYKLENSERYRGVDDVFDEVRHKINEFEQKWCMEFAFNTSGKTLADTPVRLFSDRLTVHSIFHSKAQEYQALANSASDILTLERNDLLQKNLISVLPKEQLNDEFSSDLLEFLNDADHIYQRFLQNMMFAVSRYQQNQGALTKDHRSKNALLQDAVLSILDHYNLSQFSKAVFNAFDTHLSSVKSKQPLASGRSYHAKGFKSIDISQNPGVRDTVNCYLNGLSITPTGLLATMVEEGAVILGISATATAKTVVHNFDMAYLQARLKQSFIELAPQHRKIISDYYQSRRNYQREKVSVNVSFNHADDPFLLSQAEGQSARARSLFLDSLMPNPEDGNDYFRSWVAKLLRAFHDFVAQPANRYMLALLNRTLDEKGYPALINFIKQNVENMASQHGVTIKIFFGVNAAAMHQGRYDEVLATLTTSADKVVVVSTYKSMGAGKNPDYVVEDAQLASLLKYIGANRQASSTIKTDIDTIYLEKPTRLLETDDDFKLRQLKLLHQFMSLKEAGELSHNATRTLCYNVLRGDQDPRLLKEYYQLEDYQWAIRKYIEQAVGRMARTEFKQQSICIYTDAALMQTLADDPRQPDLLSHEYLALVQKAKQALQCSLNSFTLQRRLNIARNNNIDAAKMISRLLDRLFKSEKVLASDINAWQAIREQLLKHPVIAAEDATWPTLYLQLPADSELPEYRYEGDPDGNLELYQFFNEVSTGKVVSNANTPLPVLSRISNIKEYFAAQGYQLNWPAHNWVMVPYLYTNVYLPAIAEQAVKVVLTGAGFAWQDMPEAYFEHLDALVEKNGCTIGLDVKCWSVNHMPASTTISKLKNLSQRNICQQFSYINLFAKGESRIRYLDLDFRQCSSQDAKILEVSGLINSVTAVVNSDALQALALWCLNSEYVEYKES